MKLLVIEDELKLAEYLRKGLTEEGFVVDVAHNGVDGLHLAMESDYDLIVLDGMLPGIDGLSLLAALRQSKQTPVLMLTARVRVEDRVRGLQSGADDYLVKPFAFSELLARIQVLMRRARPARATDGATVLEMADLEIDLIRRRAVRAGHRLDLTAQEFGLLALFMRRQGEVLSRTEIAEQVWDMNFDSATNVIDVAIRRLRNKLDALGSQLRSWLARKRLTRTARGHGVPASERVRGGCCGDEVLRLVLVARPAGFERSRNSAGPHPRRVSQSGRPSGTSSGHSFDSGWRVSASRERRGAMGSPQVSV